MSMIISRSDTIESLLRPIYERQARNACACGVAMAVFASSTMWMTPDVAAASASYFSYKTYQYNRDVRNLKSYQKGLRFTEFYQIEPADLIVGKNHNFLGKGFRWRVRHRQRMADTIIEKNEKYTELTALEKWAEQKRVKWDKGVLKVFGDFLRWDSFLNPIRPFPDVGGNSALHGVGKAEEDDVFLPTVERVGHTIVLGTTRVGKSRLLEILVAGDIRRNDGAVICFDPKGDAGILHRMYVEAVRCGRIKDFHIFHLGFPSMSSRFNPVDDWQRITEIAGITTNQLSDSGDGASFKAFAWLYVNLVARAEQALGRKTTMASITEGVNRLEELLYDYVVHKLHDDSWDIVSTINEELEMNAMEYEKHPYVKNRGRLPRTVLLEVIIKENLSDDPLAKRLIDACTIDSSYYDKIINNLKPFLEKLTSGEVSRLLSPAYDDEFDTRPILKWSEVLSKKGIVYIGLDAMTDKEISSVVGNAMLNGLVSQAGAIYKENSSLSLPTTVKKGKNLAYIHADEVNELMGSEFVPLVNKAGGAGLMMTAYTQTVPDIEAKLGDRSKAKQVLGNFNTVISMRLRDTETAQYMTDQLRKVKVHDVIEVSTAKDKGFLADSDMPFESSNEDRKQSSETMLVEPSDLTELPKGQAFMVRNGNEVWKFRSPMFDDKNDLIKAPSSILGMCEEMKRRYKTGDNWWKKAA